MTFTVEDLKAGVEGQYESDDYEQDEDSLYDRLSFPWGEDKENGIDIANFGKFKTPHKWGGEGQGDEAGFVIQHVESGRLFHCGAYYASYDGTNWDYAEWSEVVPVTQTVTRFKDIKKATIHPEPTIDGTLDT